MTNNVLYGLWSRIKERCYNPNRMGYENYGGRGICVCDEWLKSSKIFIQWALANGWKKGLYIDRINNDGDYCPENCRFVTPQISSMNKRNTNPNGFYGISWHKSNKRWISRIYSNGKLKHLGYFDSQRLAALRFDVEAYLTDDRERNFF